VVQARKVLRVFKDQLVTTALKEQLEMVSKDFKARKVCLV
jgi:hypothetical protein